MKPNTFPTSVFVSALLVGCANSGGTYQPIVDGPVNQRYTTDLSKCQQLATERGYINGDTKTKAVIGAGLGAIVGLADDDVSDTEGVIAGAVVGALAGGGAGMVDVREERRQIVIQCMRGRGHRVVG